MHSVKRRSWRVKMSIFQCTCSKSHLQRAKKLIFYYMQSKKTFQEGENVDISLYVQQKSPPASQQGRPLNRRFKHQKQIYIFLFVFFLCFYLRNQIFRLGSSGSTFGGSQGGHNHLWRVKMLIFHYTLSKNTFWEGENVDISLCVQ